MPRLQFNTKPEFEKWAQAQLPLLRRPCVVLLDGELGAGKTQLVRWFCTALGVQESASPTFAIHNEYRAANGPVDHVDLYRVKSDTDLENSGFWDLLRGERLLFVEWADRLPREVWPVNWTVITAGLEKVPGLEEARILNWRIRKP